MKRIRYAYTLKTTRVREDDFPYSGEVLSSPESALNFLKSLEYSDIEKFVVVYLDTKNQLCGLLIQPGTVEQTAVYPREVVKHALLNGATAVLMAHNHPSGHANPSAADMELTRQLKDLCRLMQIRLHDHIIIGHDRHYSFAEQGHL